MSVCEIILKNNKYYAKCIEHNADPDQPLRELERCDYLTQLIPGDHVLVNGIKPINLVHRRIQHSIAIVRGFHSGNAYLYCPLYGLIFNPKVVDSTVKIGDRLLILVTNVDVKIIKNYGSVHDRSKDFQIINDLNTASFEKFGVLMEGGATEPAEPLYTQPYRDLTHLNTFNIDPVESKDFDDAISIDNNIIYVSIVDINHYIKHNSPEDLQGREGAFTLYLAEGNFNIIPAEAAEEKYSLVFGEKRRTITVEIHLDDEFKVKHYEIYPASIIIKNRYNYENAPDMPYLAAVAASMKRHHLNIPQLKLIVDSSSGTLVDTMLATNTDINHRIIETLMVMTNIIVSEHLQKCCPLYSAIPQRFHSKLKELPEEPLVSDEIVASFLAIKSFALASYEADKSGHFGLGINSYTHFTSPIRRYFDVIIHRMLAGWIYDRDSLEYLLHYINGRERLIENLQRLYKSWKLNDVIKSSDIWTIHVTKVMPAGIYFLNKERMIDGFIHVSKIGSGIMWSYAGSSNTGKLVGGAASANSISIGDELHCRVEKIDIITGTMTYSILL
jgi:exoribonuclease R